MEIYFVRHGEAQDKVGGMKDEDRPLTSFGAATIAHLGRSLKGIIKRFDLILTSPFLRARQSADILGNIFGNKGEISVSNSLIAGSPPNELLNEIKKSDASHILIIGHQPYLGSYINFFTGTKEDDMSIRTATCALVETCELKKDKGKLLWIKEPADLK